MSHLVERALVLLAHVDAHVARDGNCVVQRQNAIAVFQQVRTVHLLAARVHRDTQL